LVAGTLAISLTVEKFKLGAKKGRPLTVRANRRFDWPAFLLTRRKPARQIAALKPNLYGGALNGRF
jgi:hypothetical protein